MQCPVCAAQAKNLTPATYDGVVVSCPTCGDYQVTGTVFNKLLKLAPEYRTDVLQRAKARACLGARPTISTTCF
jgi:hypothetical protein